MKRFPLTTISVVFIAFLTLPTLAAPLYTITNLGQNVFPNSINNAGQWTGSKDGLAVYYNGSQLIYINRPGELGSPGAGAAINNKGQVAGYFGLENGPASAFRATNGQGDQIINVKGMDFTRATAINDRGDLVGVAGSQALGSPPVAFFDDSDTTTILPNPPNGMWANAVNSKRQIVGGSFSSQGYYVYPFLYDNGSSSRLGPLGGRIAEPFDINDNGRIVGHIIADHNYQEAFLYDYNGGGFVVILPKTSSFSVSKALAVNQLGQIVGRGTPGIPAGPDNLLSGTAFLYSNGQTYDLAALLSPDSNITLTAAFDINDSGQIVAVGHSNDLPITLHGYLLTPIPEPSTLLLNLLPTFFLLRPRRRRTPAEKRKGVEKKRGRE